MAINLGNWSWAANLALTYGAPALAAAFGVPGPVSAFAINALKGALGLKQSAPVEEVRAAAAADPEAAKEAFQAAQSEVVARYQHMTAVAEMRGRNATEVNKTMRAELGKVSWWHWRHASGYVMPLFGVEILVMVPLAAFGILTTGDVVAIIGALLPIIAIFATLQGVITNDTSALKTTAVTGQPTPGIISTAIAAVKKR